MTDRNIINMLIDAWEALPGGRDYSPSEIEDWLADDMTPAINKARALIGRKRQSEIRRDLACTEND